MARIIIDAGITLRWLFNEENDALTIKNVLDASELVVPWLWRLEVTNAVLVRERRKLLTSSHASQLLQLLDELTIDLVDEPKSRTATNLALLARPHQLSAYDAIYLDLAIHLRLALFTQDNNLRAAAERLDIPLVSTKGSTTCRNK